MSRAARIEAAAIAFWRATGHTHGGRMCGAYDATRAEMGAALALPPDPPGEAEALREALRALVREIEETRSDTDGQWPRQDAGCIHCTEGTVPDRLNTGLCGYHQAIRLINTHR